LLVGGFVSVADLVLVPDIAAGSETSTVHLLDLVFTELDELILSMDTVSPLHL
jgi:hypothetical protein